MVSSIFPVWYGKVVREKKFCIFNIIIKMGFRETQTLEIAKLSSYVLLFIADIAHITM